MGKKTVKFLQVVLSQVLFFDRKTIMCHFNYTDNVSGSAMTAACPDAVQYQSAKSLMF